MNYTGITGLNFYWLERLPRLDKKIQIFLLNLDEYIGPDHFMETTFENWESEFLQTRLYVLLSVWLRQIGSPESKHVDAPHSETRKSKARTII